jgi:hypothetical protein
MTDSRFSRRSISPFDRLERHSRNEGNDTIITAQASSLCVSQVRSGVDGQSRYLGVFLRIRSCCCLSLLPSIVLGSNQTVRRPAAPLIASKSATRAGVLLLGLQLSRKSAG